MWKASSSGSISITPFKTIDRESIREISEFTILDGEESAVKTIRTAAKTAEIIADAVLFARDIVSAPANEMTPTDLANEARESAKGKNIQCRVLETEEIKELGMNALLGVAAGSDEPPQFIIWNTAGGRNRLRSSPWSARGSPSTAAASPSSPRKRWTR